VAVSSLVAEQTGSDGSTALVFAAQVLPIFFVAPLAGVVADRFDRKRMMAGSAWLRVVPALGLLAASALGQAWIAYLCVVSISALAAFYEPVVAAVLPNIVDDQDLSLGQTVLSSVWGTMLFLGAGIGGLVTAWLGRDASFLINAATFAVAGLLVAGVTRPFRTGEVVAPASMVAHLGEVWRFVRPRKVTKAFMLTKPGVGVGNGIVGLLPIYALRVFDAGDAGIGILLAARGLGVLVGPYIGRRLMSADGRRHVFIAGASIVTYAVAYAFLPSAPTLWLAAACVFLAHVGGGHQWVASTYGLQLTTPDRLRGRVMALEFGFATLASGISAILAGIAAELLGLRATSYLLAGASLTYAVTWLVWTRDLWASPGDPVADAQRALAYGTPTMTSPAEHA